MDNQQSRRILRFDRAKGNIGVRQLEIESGEICQD
jgi:hypothetical protein